MPAGQALFQHLNRLLGSLEPVTQEHKFGRQAADIREMLTQLLIDEVERGHR